MADKMRKGRPRGEDVTNAKLTEAQVGQILGLVAAGHPQASVARRYSVSKATVCNIVKGKSWRHVEREVG